MVDDAVTTSNVQVFVRVRPFVGWEKVRPPLCDGRACQQPRISCTPVATRPWLLFSQNADRISVLSLFRDLDPTYMQREKDKAREGGADLDPTYAEGEGYGAQKRERGRGRVQR